MKTIPLRQEEMLPLLDTCPVFMDLGTDAKSLLTASARHQQAERGDYLFHQNEHADGFYLILEGTVKIHRLSPEGREQVLHLLSSGELCGEVPVFQGGRYPASAMAMENTTLLYIPGDKFLDAAQQHPDILLELLAILSMRLRRFVNLIDDLSLKEVSARLARHLLDLYTHCESDELELDSSKAVLASRLGTIAETLSRTLKKMQLRGILDVQCNRIRVLNPDGLAQLANGARL